MRLYSYRGGDSEEDVLGDGSRRTCWTPEVRKKAPSEIFEVKSRMFVQMFSNRMGEGPHAVAHLHLCQWQALPYEHEA